MSKILSSGVVLALATGYLFCASTAKYHGYIKSLKLDSDVLDRNFHQVIYDGMLITVGPLILAVVLFAASFFLFSYAFLPAYIDFFKNNFRRKRWLARPRRNLKGKRAETALEKRAKKSSWSAASFSVVFTAALFSLAYFEREGVEAANDLKERVAVGTDASKIRVAIGEEQVEMYFLGCGDRLCAAVGRESGLVHYIDPGSYTFPFTP